MKVYVDLSAHILLRAKKDPGHLKRHPGSLDRNYASALKLIAQLLRSEQLNGVALFERNHGLLPRAGATSLVTHALRL